MQDKALWQSWAEWNTGKDKTIYFVSSLDTIRMTRDALVTEKNGQEKKFPLAEISRVVFIGTPHCPATILCKLARNSITVDIMDKLGNPQAIFHSTSGKLATHINKQLAFDERHEETFALAKNIVTAKITNCATLLKKSGFNGSELRRFGAIIMAMGSTPDWQKLRCFS